MQNLQVEQTLKKANNFIKSGQYQDASVLYSSILKKFPYNQRAKEGLKSLSSFANNTTVLSQDNEVFDIHKLISKFKDNDFENVLLIGEKLLKNKHDPNSPLIHLLMGMSYNSFSNFDLALQFYDKAIKLKPHYFDAHFNKGILLQNLNKHELAIEDFKVACHIDPGNFEVFLFIADSYITINRYEDAEKNYKISMSLNSSNINTYNNLGSALKLQNKTEEAREIINKGLNINPHHPELNNNLGAVLCDLELYDEAEKKLLIAIESKENYADAYANLGIAMRGMKKFKLAIKLKMLYENLNKC